METLIKILKSKGLNFTRRTFKFNDLLILENENINTEINEKDFEYDYVLYSLQKYLREKYDIHIIVVSSNIEGYNYGVLKEKGFLGIHPKEFPYKTYEEALEQALLEGLQLI